MSRHRPNRLRFISVWLNRLTGGEPDRTLSAELGRRKMMGDAVLWSCVVDWFFLIVAGQLEHCRESYGKALGVLRPDVWADAYAEGNRRAFRQYRELVAPYAVVGFLAATVLLVLL